VELVALPSANVTFWTVTWGHDGAYRQLPETEPSDMSHVSM
jgi:hypothetical protein